MTTSVVASVSIHNAPFHVPSTLNKSHDPIIPKISCWEMQTNLCTAGKQANKPNNCFTVIIMSVKPHELLRRTEKNRRSLLEQFYCLHVTADRHLD